MIADATPNAQIFFTLDGTNPTNNSTVYANPISVADDSKPTTIRAMATAKGFSQSDFGSATYTITIDPGTAKPVTYSPAAGQYNNPVPVGLSTLSPGATICYTIDGSAPACLKGQCQGTSAQYSAGSPISVDAPTGGGGLTVQSIACGATLKNSDPTQSIYSFKVADVTAEPASGTVLAVDPVTGSTSIALHTATASTPTDNVRIRYNSGPIGTVTDPTCSLFQSQGPNGQQTAQVTVSQNTEIRAIACRNNYADSTPQTFTYSVKLQTPVISTTQPTDGDNNNVVGSVTGVRYNAMAAADAVVVDSNSKAPTGDFCYRLGADPVCTAGVCDAATSQTSVPAVNDNTANNVRARQCKPNFIDSDVVQATYTFTVQTVALNPITGTSAGSTGPGGGTTASTGFCSSVNTVNCYEPTSTANFYDFSVAVPANLQDFHITTAKANTSGNSATGTTGETIRWAYKTGTTDLPQPADPTCAGTDGTFTGGAGGAGETRGVCSTDSGCDITGVPPFSTIKAIGCKGDFVSSPIRTLTYANPSQVVSVATPTPSAPGPYFNDTVLDFASTPSQPTTTPLTGTDVHVCWTQSLVTGPGSITPACDQVTGACKAPTGTINPQDSYGEYNPCTGVACGGLKTQTANTTGDQGFKKPLVFRTGTIVKAIACRAGVPASSVAESTPYTLKVATPTFDKPNGFVGFDTAINFATTTLDSAGANVDITYRRSDAQVHANDPACTGDIAGQQKVADFINQFDQDCGDPTLGTQCATPKEEVKLIACKPGYVPSDIATGTFEANLAAPTLTPAGNPVRGYYDNQVDVALNAPFFTGTGLAGGRVCYTTDGGTPACGAGTTCTAVGGVPQTATGPGATHILVGNSTLGTPTAQSPAVTIKAVACATGFDPSPAVSGTYNFKVQLYSISPAPGARPNGGGTSVTFTNTIPAADGTPATSFTCSGGTNNGTACTSNADCTGGGTCSNDPTTGAVLCFSTDGTDIPTDCSEIGACAGGTNVGGACTSGAQCPGSTCTLGAKVTCTTGAGGGGTFANANGTWAPAALQGISANTSIKSMACKAGFVPVARPTDSYTFGTYTRAEPIDGTNTFDVTQNKIARQAGAPWSSLDYSSESIDTTSPTLGTGGGGFFVSWTATDIYIGFQGNALTSNAGGYFQVYIKGSGTGVNVAGNTTRDNGVAGSGNEYGTQDNPTPGAATGYNYHFFISPAGGPSSAGVRVLNTAGTNWITPVTAPNNQVSLTGTLGQASAYVEWRISRADLGIAGAGSHLIMTGNVYDPVAAQKGVKFPVSDASITAATFNWGYYDANLDGSLFPSNRAYTP